MKQSTVRRERKEIFIFSARARFKLDALTRRGCDTYLSPLLWILYSFNMMKKKERRLRQSEFIHSLRNKSVWKICKSLTINITSHILNQ